MLSYFSVELELQHSMYQQLMYISGYWLNIEIPVTTPNVTVLPEKSKKKEQ